MDNPNGQQDPNGQTTPPENPAAGEQVNQPNVQQVPEGFRQPGTQTAPAVPQGNQPKTTEPVANTGSIDSFAGSLASDPYAAPALAFINAAIDGKGLDLNRAFGKAAERGDADLIDVGYLTDVLGTAAQHVVAQAKALMVYAAEKQSRDIQGMYEAAGGEQALRQAAAHFNTAAPPEVKQMVMYLMDSGDPVLMRQGAQQIMAFAKGAGMVLKPGVQHVGSPSSQKGLTKAEYIKALSERNITPERYQELAAARKLGINQGI